MKKSLVSVFAGFERQVNRNTHSIVEFGGKPKIEFDSRLREMTAKTVWYLMGGVRFYISRMTSFDAALRYRSDFTGLADTEIRAGLNTGFDLLKKFKKQKYDK